MKFNIEVDCTPDEGRRFLGMPEVAPMQKAVMDKVEERLIEIIDHADPAKLMEQWMPLTFKNLEQWQSVWQRVAGDFARDTMGPEKKP